jgi:hypothetical protein
MMQVPSFEADNHSILELRTHNYKLYVKCDFYKEAKLRT